MVSGRQQPRESCDAVGDRHQGLAGQTLPFDQLFPDRLDASNILILPILVPHLHEHRRLPFHHNDPFDRLVIAQALVEDLTLVSCDAEFAAYGMKLLW
ncbi:MAG: type II toxin-antitoxin system VapC family toxin [Verrucomicrobiaceae bacterium]|nr:type II toxin-antitoxin system VapC family toxin [Verrucomicrobiaceae bacterium]